MKVIERVVACAVAFSLIGCVAFGEDELDDAGEGPVSSGSPPSGYGNGTGSTSSLRVFATHGTYTGNLTAYLGGAVNGLAAGDTICQLRADSASLGGKWRAWLSSSEIDAIDRVISNGPWKLVGSETAFANWAQLQTEPSTPINVDEHGEVLREYYGLVHVWTGTQAGGVHSSDTCGGWTSTTARGVYGHSKEGSFEWTDYSTSDCTAEKRLICLQQGL
jgi:hypothetical protein